MKLRATPIILCLAAVLITTSANAAEPVDFARDILPVLSDNCFQCHGFDPNEGRKGDLRLDDETDAKRERGEGDETYHAIKAGDADASEILYRLTTDDADDKMPPPKLGREVTEEEIALVRRWIDEGATWGKHWAFESVIKPEVEDAADQKPGKHPIDELVERRLAAANAEAEAENTALVPTALTPTPRADRATLIRRLMLDLTGLPPTPEQSAAFLADDSAQAWERLVDQTLASKAYGERMAWDWLEAARYADTNGYQGDRERSMWPWRDWVVDAFNENLPYDEFTVWQLAGDLLPEATDEQILATGFNRNHMINGEGGRIAEENRVDYVFDMTETMGTIWLGLTLNCCRCHDHKFDPLTQREYFQFTAFFNQTPVTGGGGDPATKPVLEVETAQMKIDVAAQERESKRLVDAIKRRRAAVQKRFENWTAAEEKKLKPPPWQLLAPASVAAEQQTIKIVDTHRILTSGNNPTNDTYQIELPLDPAQLDGPLRAVKLDALRHKSMTAGGLSRAASSNFVLTDIAFELVGQDGAEATPLKIESAEASFEQKGHPISLAFNGDTTKGWAVWDNKKVDRDHAAIFRFREAPEIGKGATLRVRMRYGSRHPSHILGHFSLSATSLPKDKAGLATTKNDALAQALRTPKAERSQEQHTEIRKGFEAGDEVLTKLHAGRAATNKRIADIRKSIPKVMVMQDMATPRPTYILDRGLYTARGEEIGSGTPSFLPPLPELATGARTNRLTLARWLVDGENPLTARVTVNRVWQMLFGIGLVKTVEDFGVQAEYPVQRELLEWLAAEFVDSGWDMKQLIRTIVTSEVYQRSSDLPGQIGYAALERDPANRLLARGPRFRMPSWMIRDQALAASGLLNAERGGPSVNSYQPEGIWAEATFGKKRYSVATGEDLYRRSLYTYWRRIIGPTMFFDTAKRQVCEVKPLRTNTPMHALNTLNSVTFVEAARVLAGSLLEEKEADTVARFAQLSRRVLGREASAAERAIWQRSLERASTHFRKHPAEAASFLAHGDSKARAGLDPVEHAAWTALCLNVLNLDETLTKE